MDIKDKKLVIILDEIDGVPQVFIDGEEIKSKSKVKLDWETKDATHHGVASFEIEFIQKSDKWPLIINKKIKGV